MFMATRPPIPDPPYEGGCLCGAAHYRLDARPMAVNACHCDDCKKLTGATHLLMIVSKRNAFSHRGAVARFRKRADSGRELDIVRCAACGTRLWHEPLAAPTLVYVAAGTLDDPHWAIPASHIYLEKISPGVLVQDDAAQIVGQPHERQQIMDAFDALYGDDS
jgi:hypothetical protein